MVAEANYGGRVTDPQDRRCIKLILSDFYCPEMISEVNHKLSEKGSYFVPSDGDKADYIQFIEDKLPINDLTEVFGIQVLDESCKFILAKLPKNFDIEYA